MQTRFNTDLVLHSYNITMDRTTVSVFYLQSFSLSKKPCRLHYPQCNFTTDSSVGRFRCVMLLASTEMKMKSGPPRSAELTLPDLFIQASIT